MLKQAGALERCHRTHSVEAAAVAARVKPGTRAYNSSIVAMLLSTKLRAFSIKVKIVSLSNLAREPRDIAGETSTRLWRAGSRGSEPRATGSAGDSVVGHWWCVRQAGFRGVSVDGAVKIRLKLPQELIDSSMTCCR